MRGPQGQPCRLPSNLRSTLTLLIQRLRQSAQSFRQNALPAHVDPDYLAFVRVTDPVNGRSGYQGYWRDKAERLQLEVLFNSDGSYYAELDLDVQHPQDPRWFVESLTAWGRDGQVKIDPRLWPTL